MKIKSLRVRNYKSIIDSRECTISDTITILAGKNESGKTSVLEALEDFNSHLEIRESAIHLLNTELTPEITVSIVFDSSKEKEFLRELGIKKTYIGELALSVTKTYPAKYSLQKEQLERLGIIDKPELTRLTQIVKTKWQRVNKIGSASPMISERIFAMDFDDIGGTQSSLSKFIVFALPFLPEVGSQDVQAEFQRLLNETADHIASMKKVLSKGEVALAHVIKNYLPNFILFSSFEDVFPSKITGAELDQSEWIRDLNILCGLDTSIIKGKLEQKKRKHKLDLNANLNEDYKQFWTQDVSNLVVDWDNGNLHFWIEEDSHPYSPSQRSQGRQWHLAFYIRVSARATESDWNIILIDEPGLYLHAKAQSDILKNLEKCSKRSQVMFSTHSPYLMEVEHLNRIRLILKPRKTGTHIENKIHALADKETLTPILTAIGVGINDGIVNLDREQNVIVEGPSDYYFLTALKSLIPVDKPNFIFGGGAGNMPFVGTILRGWGCKTIYLYDNDTGKRDGGRNLRDNWLVSAELIAAVLDVPGAIEDLFSKADFHKWVCRDAVRPGSESNSEYVKKNKIDKIVVSRLFLENVQNGTKITLETSSIANTKKLFENLEKMFSKIKSVA